MNRSFQSLLPDRIALVGTIASLIIAIAPALFWLPNKEIQIVYSPSMAVETATLIVLIWTGRYVYGANQESKATREQERRHRNEDNMRRDLERQNLATAVLGDVILIEAMLNDLDKTIDILDIKTLAFPAIEHARSRSELFSTITIGMLTGFYASLRAVVGGINSYHGIRTERISSIAGSTGVDATNTKAEIHKMIATYALELRRYSQLLADRLEQEGAIKPGGGPPSISM
jgi:hypothetical protein